MLKTRFIKISWEKERWCFQKKIDDIRDTWVAKPFQTVLYFSPRQSVSGTAFRISEKALHHTFCENWTEACWTANKYASCILEEIASGSWFFWQRQIAILSSLRHCAAVCKDHAKEHLRAENSRLIWHQLSALDSGEKFSWVNLFENWTYREHFHFDEVNKALPLLSFVSDGKNHENLCAPAVCFYPACFKHGFLNFKN